MTEFLAGYLSFLEIEAQLKEEAAEGKVTIEGADPEMDKIRRFIYGHSEVSLRHHAVATFAEAQKKLASPEQTRHALDLVAELQKRVESRFMEEVLLSQRLRRIAIIGVVLVGIGALSQLIDLVLT